MCNHDDLVTTPKGNVLCYGCLKKWLPEEKGECVEEYETKDGIGLRFPKGIEAKTFLAKIEKANQGGTLIGTAPACEQHSTNQLNCSCPKHQKPSEEEREWRKALLDTLGKFYVAYQKTDSVIEKGFAFDLEELRKEFL